MSNLLEQLKQAGAFASPELHTDTFTVDDASFDVHVKELTDAAVRGFFTAAGGYDRAHLIAAAIVTDDGKPVFTVQQAKELRPSVATKLEKIALKFNGAGEAAKAEAEEAGK